MSTWKAALGVGAGATVTVFGTVPTAAVLPLVGLLADRTVGGWLPPWLFVVPVLAWAVIGGGVAARITGGRRATSVAVGGLAGGIGAATIGAVAGALFFVLLAGMTPAHTATVPVERSAITIGYGAGGGALVGVVLGVVGGFAVFYVRGGPAADHDG